MITVSGFNLFGERKNLSPEEIETYKKITFKNPERIFIVDMDGRKKILFKGEEYNVN